MSEFIDRKYSEQYLAHGKLAVTVTLTVTITATTVTKCRALPWMLWGAQGRLTLPTGLTIQLRKQDINPQAVNLQPHKR